ncbi:hypothetical protein TNIN_474821 [Trichonephila inaurata madagascariensis]|uniref:Uncharacterized protein n=1 Tax=Trichonephila inaurata madagascariensis TaxID=2747483 RepID=A0A8X6I6Q6_9ARAC|nr:hypothetical protein TNIN_474821 [Trichonephila inaurata madagascariensis]
MDIPRRLPADGDGVASGQGVKHPDALVFREVRKGEGVTPRTHPQSDFPRVGGGGAHRQTQGGDVGGRQVQSFRIHNSGRHDSLLHGATSRDVEVHWTRSGTRLNKHQYGTLEIK